ncbi:hypothetical protein JCM10450v2_005610 [Rhodotorula kratochvilovae]
MTTRPSRTTRSSVAAATAPAAPAGPAAATRTRRTTATAPPSTSTAPVRRTTRVSRANTPGALPEVKVTQTRASIARAASTANTAASSTRPLRTSSRANISTPPPAATPAVKRGTSLAVPGSSLRPKTPGSGFLARMTSRESLRQPKTPAPAPAAAFDKAIEAYDGAREPIKAYLRIRPAPPGVPLESYMQVLNETDVLMVPPLDHRLNPSSSSSSLFSSALVRSSHLNLNPASHPSGVPDDVLASPTPYSSHAAPDPSTYGSLFKFTSVFPPSASPSTPTSPSFRREDGQTQASFFRATTLPLVRDFLQKGENCLLFAYGPTGSGKTFTVQGGQGDDAGLLPRVVEVVWKSLAGKRKPASSFTPPASRAPSRAGPPLTSTPNGAGPSASPRESVPTAPVSDDIPLSDGYEYSIWVSYSEIYNEKIYDLLEAPLPTSSSSPAVPATPSGGGGGGMLKGLFRNFTTVKRSALSLKADKTAPATAAGGGQKVVGGLREVKVASADEAHNVLARGQSNRRVFSTLANRASSRSHSIFTIRLVRTSPITGAEVSTSRFSIVDLAGSERVVNTQTTGERLKEAGNINKSLMVLGQCMEVLRKNQEREKGRKVRRADAALRRSPSYEPELTMELRVVEQPAIVPFRHSKLTEMFQSFFIGDGKAVMIVNINPYETGFDENSHVMRFSAVAKSVMTVKRGPDNVVAPVVVPVPVPAPAVPAIKKREPRVVRMSLIEGGEEEEVLYEEDSDIDDDDGDEFVDALLDELSALRTALFDAQMSAAIAVSTARTQLAKEYEAKMLAMHREYEERRREEAVEADTKFNAKLDILTRLQAARTPARGGARYAEVTPSTAYDDSDEEGGSEDGEEGEEEDDSEEVRGMLLPAGETSVVESAASISPLAARVKHVSMHSPVPLGAATAGSSLARSPLGRSETAMVVEEGGGAEGSRKADAAELDEEEGEASRRELVDDEAGEAEEGEEELEEGQEAELEEELGESIEHTREEVDLSATDADATEVDEGNELGSLEEFVDDGAVEDDGGSDADYEVSPVPSPAKARAPVKAEAATPRGAGEGNDTPSPAAAEDGDDEYGEADELGFERSMVIRSGSKVKKAKRKLGAKVHDVEDLDTFEGVLSPIRKTPSTGSRAFKR